MCLFQRKERTRVLKLMPLLFFIPLLGFLVWNPYAVLDMPTFLDHSGREVHHYKVLGHTGAESIPGWNHFFFQMKQFYRSLPAVLFFCSILGLIFSLRFGKKSLIILVFPIFFIFLLLVAWDRPYQH